MSRPEDFYGMLGAAVRLAPDGLPGFASHHLKDLLYAAADLIAKERNPQTMADLRSYEDIDDERMAEVLINHLLAKSPDNVNDPDLRVFDYANEIGYAKILEAPAETPSELAQWVLAKHRDIIDGIACSKCGLPVPYDEQSWQSDSTGKHYFHEVCPGERKTNKSALTIVR